MSHSRPAGRSEAGRVDVHPTDRQTPDLVATAVRAVTPVVGAAVARGVGARGLRVIVANRGVVRLVGVVVDLAVMVAVVVALGVVAFVVDLGRGRGRRRRGRGVVFDRSGRRVAFDGRRRGVVGERRRRDFLLLENTEGPAPRVLAATVGQEHAGGGAGALRGLAARSVTAGCGRDTDAAHPQ